MGMNGNFVFAWVAALVSTGAALNQASAQTCSLAEPVVIASGVGEPLNFEVGDLHVDDQDVYFFSRPPNHEIYRVPKDGGTPMSFAPSGIGDGEQFSFEFVLDATTVYNVLYGELSLGSFSGGLFLYNKDGTQRAFIDATPNPRTDCWVRVVLETATDGAGNAYWLQKFAKPPERPADECPPPPTFYQIMRVAAGTTTPTLVSQMVKDNAAHLLADASHVYWSDDGGIWRALSTGGPPVLMLGAPGPVHGLAIDATNIYWTQSSPPSTNRLSGFDQTEQIFAGVFEGIVSDGTFIYGTVARTGPGAPANVMRLKPNGHGQEVLGKGALGTVAVDDAFIYFRDASQTEILKACKAI